MITKEHVLPDEEDPINKSIIYLRGPKDVAERENAKIRSLGIGTSDLRPTVESRTGRFPEAVDFEVTAHEAEPDVVRKLGL